MARNNTLLARNATTVPETTNFILNVAPIQFEDATVEVGVLHTQSRQQWESLQSQHQLTHIFHREEGSRVVCVADAQGHSASGSLPQGAKREIVQLREQPELCLTLIRNALLHYLYQVGRPSLSLEPMEIMGNQSNENLLASAIPSDCPAWLAVRSCYQLSVRTFDMGWQAPGVGLALDVSIRYVIDLACDELAAQGFPLSGLVIGEWVNQQDARLAPDFRVIGRVDQVNNGHLLLTDTLSEVESIEASRAYLQPSPHNFQLCLKHLLREHSRHIEPEVQKQITAFLSGPKRLQKLQTVMQRFSRLKLKMTPDVSFSIGAFLGQKPDLQSSAHDSIQVHPVKTASKPVYVFDLQGQNTNLSKDRGLDEYGPLSKQNVPAQPQICVICQSYRKELFEAMLQKWLHGIPSTKREKSLFPGGLIGKYQLNDASLQVFLVNGDTSQAYRRAAQTALQQQRQRGRTWDLAVVQTNEWMHNLEAAQNPFHTVQALFMAHQIPAQEFQIENAKSRNRALSYLLNNMALVAFSQMGGVPWGLQTSQTDTLEIVIGLDHALIGDDDLNANPSMIIITTVFTGSGTYLFSTLSDLVSNADYEETIGSTLSASIEAARSCIHAPAHQPIRVTIHANGDESGDESRNSQAIKQALFTIPEGVEVTLLHVLQEHPHLLFDQTQSGVQHYASLTKQGAFAPMRGSFLPLSDCETLLCLCGAKEIESLQEGLPRPLLLKLDSRSSSYQDMNDLVQQVFNLSSHSWQRFAPVTLPATLFYAKLIKRKLHQLMSTPDWQPDLLLGQTQTRLWFL